MAELQSVFRGPAPTTLFTSYSCNTVATSAGLGLSFVTTLCPFVSAEQCGLMQVLCLQPDKLSTPTLRTLFLPAELPQAFASPYPNGLAVSGLLTTGVSVKSVTITNYSHTFPDDVDLVLVSPSGQAVILMSDCAVVVHRLLVRPLLLMMLPFPALLMQHLTHPALISVPTSGAGDNWAPWYNTKFNHPFYIYG